MASFIVTTLADENDAGATAANPGGSGLSLREALTLTNANFDADTITFAAGLTGGATPGVDDGTLALAFGQLEILNSVAIVGDTNGDGDADITIDAGGLSRGLDVIGGISTLDAVNIMGGSAGVMGGGISIAATAELAVTHAIIQSGESQLGGGIHNAGTLRLTDSIVTAGRGRRGGNIYNTGTAILTDSTISSALIGGGIYNTGTIDLTDCIIRDNFGTGYTYAGGLANTGTARLVRTTVSDNSGVAGGLFNKIGTLTLTQSTLIRNSGTDTAAACSTISVR